MTDSTYVRDKFVENVVPPGVKSKLRQLNISADPELLNAFRGAAWLQRVTHAELLWMLINDLYDKWAMDGTLDREAALQRTKAARATTEATEVERIV